MTLLNENESWSQTFTSKFQRIFEDGGRQSSCSGRTKETSDTSHRFPIITETLKVWSARYQLMVLCVRIKVRHVIIAFSRRYIDCSIDDKGEVSGMIEVNTLFDTPAGHSTYRHGQPHICDRKSQRSLCRRACKYKKFLFLVLMIIEISS